MLQVSRYNPIVLPRRKSTHNSLIKMKVRNCLENSLQKKVFSENLPLRSIRPKITRQNSIEASVLPPIEQIESQFRRRSKKHLKKEHKKKNNPGGGSSHDSPISAMPSKNRLPTLPIFICEQEIVFFRSFVAWSRPIAGA